MTTGMTDDAVPSSVPKATTDLDLAAALHEAAHRLSDPARPLSSSDSAQDRAATLVRQFLTALETGDLRAIEDLVCEDVVYRIPGRSRISGVFEGVDGIVAACGVVPRSGATDLRSEQRGLFIEPSGDNVATFHRMQGSLDGQPVEIDIALCFALRDGRIATITEYSADQYAADDLFGA